MYWLSCVLIPLLSLFQDEQRLKCYCVSVASVNFVQETRRNIELINQMM